MEAAPAAAAAPIPLRHRVKCAVDADVYAMQLCSLPEQQRVAVVCSDFALRLYDQEQLLFAGQCRGHTERIHDLSSSGHMLLSSSDDGTARLWDTRTQAAVQTFGGLGSPPVLTACADPTGHMVATGGEGGVVQLWDVRTAGPTRAYYDLHTEDIVRVRFQPEAPARLLSAADDGLISIIDVTISDVDDALVDCLSVGSGIDSFGFFGHTPEDSGVWVCCSDQRFELWSLAAPPAEEDMLSEGPPRLMHFSDARPAVTALLQPFGGIGGGLAAHPQRQVAALADAGARGVDSTSAMATPAETAYPVDDEFGIVGGASGMEGLEEGEPDDADETQYLVGCEFDNELVMMAGHHDGRLSLLSLAPSGARFKAHLGPGGHTATVRDMVLLTNGAVVTCAEDASLCLWGHPTSAEDDGGMSGGDGERGGLERHSGGRGQPQKPNQTRFTPY